MIFINFGQFVGYLLGIFESKSSEIFDAIVLKSFRLTTHIVGLID